MNLQALVATVRDLLVPLGYRIVDQASGGPMGSGRVRLSNERCDVDLNGDRGRLSVTIGRRGGPTWDVAVWAEVLGIESSQQADESTGVDFLAEHLQRVEQALAADPGIDNRLRETNWRRVKEHLGLDPEMPRPGESGGDRGLSQ